MRTLFLKIFFCFLVIIVLVLLIWRLI